MRYIDLANRYWQLHSKEAFMPTDSHLYFCLINAFNAKGQKDRWPESLAFTDGTLAALAGIAIKTLESARKRLSERGLLSVSTRGKGARKGADYFLTSPSTYPLTSPSTYANFTEVDAVEDQPTQEPLQQLTQRPKQILPRFYIYKETILHTPDKETLTKILSVAHRDDVTVRLAWMWLLQNKKPPAVALPPVPTAPSPKPRVARPELNIPFDVWWEAYGKKVDRKVCEPKWNRLTDAQREAALSHTTQYVIHTPNPRYRRNPETYLNRESWGNDILADEPEPLSRHVATDIRHTPPSVQLASFKSKTPD
ncbi:hypothetical protein F5984_15190 [Rudanella paleaurantiibacter]|uniref:Helix-turn-helix domain-containing protein n=1 Tax=Rudanella paleaurantiibacter TaxID=2614655 RepID=A0A7J5TZI3_9BACT|nr:hypothetical protein [Rudanella paleaurantiibacter]KAB7730485.1 hypothetical protein F5984_15190 [Rudanella paleaurantiibacter]